MNFTGRHVWIRPIVLVLLQVILAVELWLLVSLAAWMHAGLVASLMMIVVLSELARRRLAFAIPMEFQIAGILFMFAAIFLGEVRGYYERIWWWDLALHGSAGLLLGTIGFLLVYFLNESKTIQLHMRPAFVAFFAFCFAMTIGARHFAEYLSHSKSGHETGVLLTLVHHLGGSVVAGLIVTLAG